MVKTVTRQCPHRKCGEMVKIENPRDITGLGALETKFCEFHEKLYVKTTELFEKLVPKYQKMGLKNKFGRPITFDFFSDVSNYLWVNDKKAWNKVEREAIKVLKRAKA